MKKLIALVTLVSAASAFSQGTVNFNNFASTTPSVACKFYYEINSLGPVKSATALAINGATQITGTDGFIYGGKNAMAGLYGGAAGADPSTFTLLVPALGFKSGGSAGFINTTSGSRIVQGVDYGQPADFIVKVWDTGAAAASYEEALTQQAQHGGAYLTQSSLIHVAALGGGGSPPAPAANLAGLNGQVIQLAWVPVPEPSIIGLGILGAAAGLVLFRRRN